VGEGLRMVLIMPLTCRLGEAAPGSVSTGGDGGSDCNRSVRFDRTRSIE
jgi:hypothetical protein